MSNIKIMDIQVLLSIYADMRQMYAAAITECYDHADIAERASARGDDDGAKYHDGVEQYYRGRYLGISDGMWALRDLLKEAGLRKELAAIDVDL